MRGSVAVFAELERSFCFCWKGETNGSQVVTVGTDGIRVQWKVRSETVDPSWQRFSSLPPPQPYFSGTRSLSPMSSLFGSIWTPQSEPYPSHFQPERSAPVSPITPPHSPFSREPVGACGPLQYSSFNPFGPHMNLDIWNSSSNRSSNSQLSNDSGYCGDV